MKNAHRIQAKIYAYINSIFPLTASSLPRLVSPFHSRLSFLFFFSLLLIQKRKHRHSNYRFRNNNIIIISKMLIN